MQENKIKRKVVLNGCKNRVLAPHSEVVLGLRNESKLEDYKEIKFLGEGASGIVTLYENIKAGNLHAIKRVEKKRLTDYLKATLIREVEILEKSDHPNIIKGNNHFEDDDYIYISLDYAEKGDLRNKLQKAPGKILSEKQVKPYIKQLVEALDYLHSQEIVHRDIKTENCQICADDTIKLIDFGTSNDIGDRFTKVGTEIYMPPEIVKNLKQTDKVDIWCLGILLYELLCGKTPFEAKNGETLSTNIKEKSVEFDQKYGIVPQTKAFIKKLLSKNPEYRPTAKEMMKDPFFADFKFSPYVRREIDIEVDEDTMPDDLVASMQQIDAHKRNLHSGSICVSKFGFKNNLKNLDSKDKEQDKKDAEDKKLDKKDKQIANENPEKTKLKTEISGLEKELEDLKKDLQKCKDIKQQNLAQNKEVQIKIDEHEDQMKKHKEQERVLVYQDKEYKRQDIEDMELNKTKNEENVAENKKRIIEFTKKQDDECAILLDLQQKLFSEEEVRSNLLHAKAEKQQLQKDLVEIEAKIKQGNIDYHKNYDEKMEILKKLEADKEAQILNITNEEKELNQQNSLSSTSDTDLTNESYLFNVRKSAIFLETVKACYDKILEEGQKNKNLNNEQVSLLGSKERLNSFINSMKVKCTRDLKNLRDTHFDELIKYKEDLQKECSDAKTARQTKYEDHLKKIDEENNEKKVALNQTNCEIEELQKQIELLQQSAG